MASTAIIINATDALGKSAQKSVTNVNPAATNAQLVELGQMLTAVSNNTYGGTVRIDKTDCDNEPVPTKITSSFTRVGNESVSYASICATGDTGLKVATFTGENPLAFALNTLKLKARTDGSDCYLYFATVPGGMNDPGTFMEGETHDVFLYLPETAAQTAAQLHIGITG